VTAERKEEEIMKERQDGRSIECVGLGRREAAKTTIVGGQPPGNARTLASIPVGLERLLAMAAANPDFAAILFERREEALAASGVELTATERAIFRAIPVTQLQRQTAELSERLAQPDRRSFFEQAAACVVLVAGGAGLATAAGCKDKDGGGGGTAASTEHQNVTVQERPRSEGLDAPETGHRPDYPPPTGARPDHPPPRPDAGAPQPQPTRGIRPDRPRTGEGDLPASGGGSIPPANVGLGERPPQTGGGRGGGITGIRP
jgi:hypothetical protein